MGRYDEEVDKLAALAGCSINPLDMAPLNILESEVEDLAAENKSYHDALKMLDEQVEKKKAELHAQRELDQRYRDDAPNDLDHMNQFMVLIESYIDTIEKGDEFVPNKVSRDIDYHSKELKDQLKSLYAKCMQLVADKEKLHILRNQCDELRDTVGQ